MVRIGTSRHGTQPEDDEGHEFSATAGADGRGSEQRGNSTRSKHSETEQRRRCKINESCAQMESFIDHPDIMKSDSRHENVFQPMRNEQKSAESNFSGDAAHRGKDLLSGSDTSAVPLGVPYQPSIHRSGTGVLPSDTIACQPLLQTCWSKPSTSECPIAGSSSNETKKK
ncbi:hypothetical protein Droror1_Dr00008879 [Drosera rotundifolia]